MSSANDRGAVLLTTLLIMSIMATVAVNIMEDIRFAVKRTANVESYAQADWYMRAAEDYAQSYLGALVSSTDPAALTAALARAEPVILPIDGGAITLTVRDGSTCISLGGLSDNNGRKLFRQLLEAVGWDSLGAANLTSVAADWIDTDSQLLPGGAEDFAYLGLEPAYRAANAPLTSVGELRALSTMSEEKFIALRPFVCARENNVTQINVDSLNITQAPTLAAVLGGANQLALAQQIIAARPPEGYQSLSALSASPLLTDRPLTPEESAFLIFAPTYLWVEASVSFSKVTRHAVMEFESKDGQMQTIFKRFGTDERRPAVLKTTS